MNIIKILVLLFVFFSEYCYGVEDFNQLPLELQQRLEEARYKVRIKDIVSFQGIRDNILMGYGLVVGLDGTGDNLQNSTFTQQELESFLSRIGINTKGSNMKTRNIAAVTITATLPPFTHAGNRIDVTVSALGDAKSLKGGVLLATPLLAADGDVYAIAQGNILIANRDASEDVNRYDKRLIYTTGYIGGGGIIEKEIDFSLNSMSSINIGLHNPDTRTATNIADVINEELKGKIAKAIDPATVHLTIPQDYQNDVLGLLNKIEDLTIITDIPARIIIDSRTGIVVMNNNVRVSSVAVSHGNLMIQVRGVESRDRNINTKITELTRTASLNDLIQGLNLLGVDPRSLIEILQSLKNIGALQAEIIIR